MVTTLECAKKYEPYFPLQVVAMGALPEQSGMQLLVKAIN
jgi:hypothetical protein